MNQIVGLISVLYLVFPKNFILNFFSNRLLRRDVLAFACENDLPDCVDRAKRWFDDWMNNGKNNTYILVFSFNFRT